MANYKMGLYCSKFFVILILEQYENLNELNSMMFKTIEIGRPIIHREREHLQSRFKLFI